MRVCLLGLVNRRPTSQPNPQAVLVFQRQQSLGVAPGIVDRVVGVPGLAHRIHFSDESLESPDKFNSFQGRKFFFQDYVALKKELSYGSDAEQYRQFKIS